VKLDCGQDYLVFFLEKRPQGPAYIESLSKFYNRKIKGSETLPAAEIDRRRNSTTQEGVRRTPLQGEKQSSPTRKATIPKRKLPQHQHSNWKRTTAPVWDLQERHTPAMPDSTPNHLRVPPEFMLRTLSSISRIASSTLGRVFCPTNGFHCNKREIAL
jgi:hypothetical protein